MTALPSCDGQGLVMLQGGVQMRPKGSKVDRPMQGVPSSHGLPSLPSQDAPQPAPGVHSLDRQTPDAEQEYPPGQEPHSPPQPSGPHSRPEQAGAQPSGLASSSESPSASASASRSLSPSPSPPAGRQARPLHTGSQQVTVVGLQTWPRAQQIEPQAA